MGFLRRRRRDESPAHDEITITLDAPTSAQLRYHVMVRRHGEEHPASVDALRQVAHLLTQDPQRDEEAAELLLTVARLTYLDLGPDHPDTLAAVYQAADMTAATGHLAQAEEMLRDTLPRQERVLGRDHADTLTTAQALGVVLVGLGRPAEAVALHQDVTERRTRVLGAHHDDTRISRGELADALRSADRASGARSTHAATTRNNLASTLVQLGRLDEAAQALRAVLAMVADRPDQAALAAGVRNNLAAALFELGQYREAGSLLRDSVAERERLYGPDHPDTVASVVNLARVLAADGNRAEAARLVRRGLAHYERRLPAAHPRIAELRDVLEQLG